MLYYIRLILFSCVSTINRLFSAYNNQLTGVVPQKVCSMTNNFAVFSVDCARCPNAGVNAGTCHNCKIYNCP